MAEKPDDRVLRTLNEIRATQEAQGKALARMEKQVSAQLKELTSRVERLEEAMEDKL